MVTTAIIGLPLVIATKGPAGVISLAPPVREPREDAGTVVVVEVLEFALQNPQTRALIGVVVDVVDSGVPDPATPKTGSVVFLSTGTKGPVAEQVASLLDKQPERRRGVLRRDLSERELALLGLQRQQNDLIDLADDQRLLREGAINLSYLEKINLNERVSTQLDHVRLLGEGLQKSSPSLAPELKPTSTPMPVRGIQPAVTPTSMPRPAR
jgi:hypothetical protein